VHATSDWRTWRTQKSSPASPRWVLTAQNSRFIELWYVAKIIWKRGFRWPVACSRRDVGLHLPYHLILHSGNRGCSSENGSDKCRTLVGSLSLHKYHVLLPFVNQWSCWSWAIEGSRLGYGEPWVGCHNIWARGLWCHRVTCPVLGTAYDFAKYAYWRSLC